VSLLNALAAAFAQHIIVAWGEESIDDLPEDWWMTPRDLATRVLADPDFRKGLAGALEAALSRVENDPMESCPVCCLDAEAIMADLLGAK